MWCVFHEPGVTWNKPEANKSYSSYNIVYVPQDIPSGHRQSPVHPLEVKMGMGIRVHPAASKETQISFIHRNLVPIWVYDSTSKAGIRGIALLMSTYLDDIKTNEGLWIYEEDEIDLGTGISIVPKSKF
ncbi:hypothetical protein K438DRAFT_100745 [Mycena galopus ATCC 62051]|nr:hypothetical protein K438DRAFT_100745 [Mycena galopus ATCC 62051]